MAGILEEFDDATPLKGTFCSRLSVEEYEEEASSCTKKALRELMSHLDKNPREFKAVLRKRKRDDTADSGVLSFIKVKLSSFFGKDSIGCVSDTECQMKLEALKEEMMKAFNYTQESKGKRYSKRVAEREIRRQIKFQQDQENQSFQLSSPANLPTAPPPPPPPPPPPKPLSLSAHSIPVHNQSLTRQPLSERPNKVARKIEKKSVRNLKPHDHDRLLQQIKGSECKKRLRKTTKRSPGRTPLALSRRYEPDLMPYFNAKLSEKFRNAKSPENFRATFATPGAFGSP